METEVSFGGLFNCWASLQHEACSLFRVVYQYKENLKSHDDFTHAYCFLVLEAKVAIPVHDSLSEVDVPVLVLAIEVAEPGTEDGLGVALDVETNILGGLEEV